MPPEDAIPPAAEAELAIRPAQGRVAERRLLLDVFLYAPGRAVTAASQILTLVLVARFLAPEELGAYALLASIAPVLALVLDGWLEQAVLRFFPEFRDAGDLGSMQAHNRRILALLCAAVAVAAAPLLAWLFWADSPQRWAAAWLVGLVVSTMAFANSQAFLQAARSSGLFALGELLRGLGTLVAAAAFVGLGRRDAASMLCAATLASLAGFAFSARRSGLLAGAGHKPVRPYLVAALRYGGPLIGWLVCSNVLVAADRYLVQHFLGTEQAGIYYTDYQLLPGALLLVFTPLLLAAHPVVMNSAALGDVARTDAIVRRFTRIFLLVALPVGAVVAALARPATQALLGSAFLPGAVVVPWVAAGLVCWGASMYGHKRFEVEKRTSTMLLFVAGAALTNLALNVLLIPRLGLEGAAIATFVAYAEYAVLVLVYPGTTHRWDLPWATLARSFAASLLGGALAAAVQPHLPGPALLRLALAATLGLAAYAGAAWLLGERLPSASNGGAG